VDISPEAVEEIHKEVSELKALAENIEEVVWLSFSLALAILSLFFLSLFYLSSSSSLSFVLSVMCESDINSLAQLFLKNFTWIFLSKKFYMNFSIKKILNNYKVIIDIWYYLILIKNNCIHYI
jgi:hypothetical protein